MASSKTGVVEVISCCREEDCAARGGWEDIGLILEDNDETPVFVLNRPNVGCLATPIGVCCRSCWVNCGAGFINKELDEGCNDELVPVGCSLIMLDWIRPGLEDVD